MSRRGVGIHGYLYLLAWATVGPALVRGPRVYWVLGTVALLSWLVGARTWRSLANWRTWLFVVSLALLGGLAVWQGGAAASAEASLQFGLAMAARAVAILIAVDTLATSVSVGELAALLEGLGLKGLGFSVGVAFNLLPTLRQTAASAWAALRLRGGPGRQPAVAMRRLALTILALTLERAQGIVDAAESRGFSPTRPLAERPRWQRQDLLLALSLAAWAAVLALS